MKMQFLYTVFSRVMGLQFLSFFSPFLGYTNNNPLSLRGRHLATVEPIERAINLSKSVKKNEKNSAVKPSEPGLLSFFSFA